MITRRPLLAGLAALAAAGPAVAEDPPETGTWCGVLTAGQVRLRIRIDVRADGSLTLSSPDQGANNLPATRQPAAGANNFRFAVPVVQGAFEGRRDGQRIEGAWTQGGASLPLVFTRDEPPNPATQNVPAILQGAPQPLTPERLEAIRTAESLPALVAAAARRGTAPRYWISGERLRSSGRAVTQGDLWHIGSMTKSMTATLVGAYVDEGRLSWDDTVGDLLGGVLPDIRPEYRAVNFRHLLSHRSGMPGNLPAERLAAYSRDLADARQERRAWARESLQMAPLAAPGAQFEYSNNGYIVVGAALEAKFGDAWETQIRRRLFEPLGMASAGFGPAGHQGQIDQPIGHVQAPEGMMPAPINGGLIDNPAALGPAGRVHLTLEDLLKYLAAHRDQTSLLRPATWDVLQTAPFGGNYAFGWIVNPNGVRWHNGSNTLFYSEMAFDRERGLIAAAAANAASGARAVDRTLVEASLAVR